MADIGGSNGCRVQLRAPRKNGWTKTRRTNFLRVLATTCNVRAAARSVCMSDQSAHELRQRDGQFSLLWAEALELGYERLENELVARALGQVSSGDNPSSAEIATLPAEPLPFDPQLAIQVLKLRGQQGYSRLRSGGVTSQPKTQGEADAALLKRLDALAARRQRERDAEAEARAPDASGDDASRDERAA